MWLETMSEEVTAAGRKNSEVTENLSLSFTLHNFLLYYYNSCHNWATQYCFVNNVGLFLN